MVVRLNPVEFAKAMMKKKKQLVPTPIVLDNEIAGIVYGYYEGEDFYIWIVLMSMFLKKKN